MLRRRNSSIEDLIKIPKTISKSEAFDYFSSIGLDLPLTDADEGVGHVNKKLQSLQTYPPDLVDLYILHKLVLLNKRTTVLEFGTGWSTLVMADALSRLKDKHQDEVKSLRRNNPFELYGVDDDVKYIEISKSRLSTRLQKIACVAYSRVQIGCFADRICSYYDNLPLVNPDLVYIDGPDQFKVEGSIRGWSTRHKDMMPMIADVLAIEHYFNPGTIIIVDGRAANARFIKANLQRDWLYLYKQSTDHHYFYLNEHPLGKYSSRLKAFYAS